MRDGMINGAATETEEEFPGFFGVERLPLTDDVAGEVWALIDDYMAQNRGGRERLIPLLHKAQGFLGYLPFAVQEYIADKLGLSPIEVYGVVSFYHFFTTTPRGKHEMKVCMGTACFVRHAVRLIETLKRTLGVDVGGVTEDRLFSVEQVRCLGACGLAPAMMHNNETLGNLTSKELRETVGRIKAEARREEGSKPSEKSSE